MNDTDRPSEAAFGRMAAICAAATCLFTLLVLVGWVTGRLGLAKWHADSLPMAPSAAVGFLLLGAGLLVCVRWPGKPWRACAELAALLVTLLACLILAGFVGRFNLALEHVLFGSPRDLQGMGIGHMSLITAGVLLWAGLALLALCAPAGARGRARWRTPTSLVGPLALGVTAVGAVVLLGYLYGTPLLYGGPIIPVSLPTAAAMLLTGAGLLAAAGPQAWPMRLFSGISTGARLSRALLPILLCLIVATNWLAIGLLNAGVNPALAVSIRALVSLAAVTAVVVFIARRVGGEIEQAERSSAERYRAFYDNSPLPFHSVDSAGRFVEVNDAFLETLGYSREEIIGRWCGEIMAPETRVAFPALFELYKERGVTQALEQELVRKDGSSVHVIANARLSRDTAGNFLKDYCFWSDITDLKLAERELEKAKAVAEEANAARDRMLATVSHELRTPLTPVLVTLSLWQEQPPAPDTLSKELAMMRDRIELEARLIDGLLDLTRMTRGRLPLKEEEQVDAHALLRQTLTMAQEDAEVGHPTIQLELKAKAYLVRTDPIRLQQACWNIIKNALQYTPDSGTVTLRSRNTISRRPALELEFADTGAGIDPEFLPRIFNEFERGPQPAGRHTGGLGVGLSIAKSLIEQLGGTLEASSEGLGKGATFTVRLPLAEAGRLDLPMVPPAFVPAYADVAAAPLRILLVEDDAETSEVFCRALRGQGYHVRTAVNVQQALAAGEREKFDLLLCDIGLPDGSGWDVMRWFGKKQPLPGIALSGYGTPQDHERSRDAGFALHLVKPVAIGTLRTAIQKVHAAAEPKPT